MKKFVFFLMMLGFGILVISACNPPPCGIETTYGPDQIAPLHNSMVGDLRPVLSWVKQGDCAPDEFIINLSLNGTNGTITSSVFGGPTGSPDESWSPPGDLVVGNAYIWDVAAKNATHTSQPSDEWQFIVGNPCDALSLIAPVTELPVDGGTVTTSDPTYTWGYTDPTCTPEGYHLQVSPIADFSVIEVDVRQNKPFKAWITGFFLTDCTDYYWRVAAIESVTDGPWSNVSEFSTDLAGTCLCGPGTFLQPSITAPGVFEVVPDLVPSIQWTDPSICAVEGYAIHLSPDSDFTDTTYNGGTGTPSTSWGPGSPLQQVTRYYTRVAGMVGSDMGPWSSTRSFFTGPECTSPSELVAPELFSPAHNDVITELFATLEFGPGTSPCLPDGYFINLYTGSSGNLLGSFGAPSGTVMTDPLDDCKIYNWEVAAHQGGTNGPFSETRRFYTNESGTCIFITFVRPFIDIACLFGPDPVFHTVGYILGIEETEVFAMSLDGNWLAVQNPDDVDGAHCWGRTDQFEVMGEIPINLARWPSPPFPEPEPVCDDKAITKETCEVTNGRWVPVSGQVSAVTYECTCD